MQYHSDYLIFIPGQNSIFEQGMVSIYLELKDQCEVHGSWKDLET